MVKAMISEVQRRGHNFKKQPSSVVWHRRNKKVKYYKEDKSQMDKKTNGEFDKEFYEGLEDLFENYDNTLKNLVNK